MAAKSQSPTTKKASKSGVRDMVTRSNVILLLMIATVIVSLVNMILFLSNEEERKEVEKISDTLEKENGRENETLLKIESVFYILNPILLFSCVALMLIVRLLLPNNKIMNYVVDLLLLVMSCLCCGFVFNVLLKKDNQGDLSIKKLDSQGRLIVANILLCLVFSVIQFLNMLRP